MKDTLEVLRLLMEVVPPGPGQHHSITYDESMGGLVVTLFLGDLYAPFALDGQDMEEGPTELVGGLVLGLLEHPEGRVRRHVQESLGWVSVGSLLPPENMDVLATDGAEVYKMWHDRGQGWMLVGKAIDAHLRIAHWRPLPPVPEEEVVDNG